MLLKSCLVYHQPQRLILTQCHYILHVLITNSTPSPQCVDDHPPANEMEMTASETTTIMSPLEHFLEKLDLQGHDVKVTDFSSTKDWIDKIEYPVANSGKYN